MTDLVQTLGFDASQALTALAALDSGFAKLQGTIKQGPAVFSSFNQAAGKTDAVLQQLAAHANSAYAAMAKLSTVKPPAPPPPLPPIAAPTAANPQGPGSVNAGRIIEAAGIIQGLNLVKAATRGAFEGFIDFNRAVAEIETISPEPVTNLATQVRKLSDEFNAPILDVAKAKYDIVSNGFQGAADSSAILTAALKLSKTGLSDTAQAADLLSTILNAYGKSAQEAETLSAKLFRTVDLGRVNISQLATAFGRVAPIGKEIGATEDELLAAFSSITIGGVNASEAATQIRATLSSLLKPSEDAAESLRALGFETGEQLIRAKGFKGALDALISTTDGSTSSIAKLFPNVRALNGVLRETGTGADIFTQHLKEIQQASRELLNQKFELRISSDAEKVAADLNKVKNFFTVDIGSELVGATASFFKFTGGVDNSLAAMRALAPVVAIGVAGLVTYNATVIIAAGVHNLFTASATRAAASAKIFAGSLGLLVAAVAAYQAGQFIGGRITESLRADAKAARDAAEQRTKFAQDQADARSNLDKVESDKKFQLLNDQVAVARKAYFAQTDAAKEANKQLLDDDKATFDKVIGAREKFAQDLQRAARQADADIVDSRKRVNDITSRLDDQRFAIQNKRFTNDLTRSFRERQRAEQLASQAGAGLGRANTPEEQASAQAAFERAEGFAKQAIASAETAKNVGARIQAERTLDTILKGRIAAEQSFQRTRDAAAQKLAAAAAAEESRITKLKGLAKEFLDSAKLTGKDGEFLPKATIDKNIATAKTALSEFKKTAFGDGAKFNLQDLFSFDQLEQRLSASFTKGEVKSLLASGSALDSLRKQVQGSLDQSNFIISLAPNAAKLQGLSRGDQINEVTNQLAEQQNNLNRLRTSEDARGAAQRTIAEEAGIAEKSYAKQVTYAEQLIAKFQVLIGQRSRGNLGPDQAKEQLDALRKQTQQLIADPNATAAQINKLRDAFEGLQKLNSAGALGKGALGLNVGLQSAQDEFESLRKIFDERQKIKNLDKVGDTSGALESAQKALDSADKRREAEKAAADALKSEKDSAGAAATSSAAMKLSLDASVLASSKIATNLAAAAQAAQLAANVHIGSGSETATAAAGGLIQRFAAGGAAKGTDSINAKLSPDETVINARSSRKFFPQFQSINAGAEPSFNRPTRQGDTINVGDIVVNGTSDPKSTAREVMGLIRREQRRGTAR